MSWITIPPIKPLIEALKRFHLRHGEKVTLVTRDKPWKARHNTPHHRHSAFLELP